MKFAIDAFGGDNAPEAVIRGSIDAMQLNDDFSIIFTGDESAIYALLNDCEYDKSRVEVVHAPDIITCEDQPTLAVRRKKESSIVKALHLVADGKADCFISAGSTGAVLAGATLIVHRIPGVKRPALAPVLPTLKGPMMLIDCGANVDCTPEYLLQFAYMGSAYMSGVLGIERPRVGLINNGTEEGKGNALTKEAYSLLKAAKGINFVGNCEARELMSGDYDVIVCDGFVGNAVLKTLEGAVASIMTMLKTEIKSSKRASVGAMLSKNAFKALKTRMDYTEYGGAPLLGINGGIIKAHGSSDERAVCSAIGQARKLILGNVTNTISGLISREMDPQAGK